MAEVILRNGKTLKGALAELGKYQECTKQDYNNNSYYKFGEYMQRVDDVFGADGYGIEYSEFETVILPCVESIVNMVVVKVTCTFLIYGENGEVVKKVSGIGTEEIERNTSKLGYINLNNLGIFVQQSAFKAAMKMLNIFDCNKYGDPDSRGNHGDASGKKNYSANGSGKSSGGRSHEKKASKGESLISLSVTKPPEVICEDTQTKMSVYRLVGNEIVGNACRSKPSAVILYPNCYKKCADWMNYVLSKEGPFKVTIKVVEGRPEDGYNNVYIFKGVS